jgi:hypothetical protein
MERRIFVLDADVDADVLIQLSEWAGDNKGLIDAEEIRSGDIITPFVRVSLEFAPSIKEIPKIPDYMPLSISITLDRDEIYGIEQQQLDCAILSAYTRLPIVTIKQQETPAGLEISFFIEGGEPLWIDSMEWPQYAELIRATWGYHLVSPHPVFALALQIAKIERDDVKGIIKHPNVDVWYGPPNNVDFSEIMKHLDNVFRITLHPSGTGSRSVIDELIRAYEYQKYRYRSTAVCRCTTMSQPLASSLIPEDLCQCKVDTKLPDSDEYYYLVSQPPFTAEWFQEAQAVVSEGQLPAITISIPDPGGNIEAVRHAIIDSYLSIAGSAWLTADLLEGIRVLRTAPKIITVSMYIDTKRTLDAALIGVNSLNNYQAVEVKNQEEGLLLRYRLSKLGIASLMHNLTVTWKGQALPPSENNLIQQLKTEMIRYIERTKIIGENITNLNVSQLFSLIKDGYSTQGFITVGPLKGLRDKVIIPTPIKPLDGIVISSWDESETEISFEVGMMDGTEIPLLQLHIPPDFKGISEDRKAGVYQNNRLTSLVSLAWNKGDFLSLWARAYIQNYSAMSYASPFIPFELRHVTAGASQYAIAYLEALNEFHGR